MKVSFVKYENITFPPMQSVCANVLKKHNPPPLADKFCLLVWIRVIAYDMHMFCFKDKLILSQEVSYFWAKRINYDSKYPWLLPGVLEHLVIWGMFLGFLLRGAISEVCMCVCVSEITFFVDPSVYFGFLLWIAMIPSLWMLLMREVHLTRWHVTAIDNQWFSTFRKPNEKRAFPP